MNKIDNELIYDDNWTEWRDMKVIGPASKWLRFLIFDIINDNIKKSEIKSVLDFGCGEGTTTYYLAKELNDSKIVGADFSETGISNAKKFYKLNNLKFVHDENSSSVNEKYDLITSFEVLEHIDDWKQTLKSLATSTNKYLLLSFPTGKMRPFEINVGHYRNFKKGEIEDFLAEQGFKVVKTYYAGFPFYSPLYRDLCNLTNAASNNFTTGKYTYKQKLISHFFYFLFRFFSTKNKLGDQFCGLFIKS
jgi:SAM-dependent methyltransferase